VLSQWHDAQTDKWSIKKFYNKDTGNLMDGCGVQKRLNETEVQFGVKILGAQET